LDNPQYNHKLNFEWNDKKLKKWREYIKLDDESRIGTSQYIGVHFHKQLQKWVSKIFDEDKKKNVFYYHSKNEKIVAIKRDLFLLENSKYRCKMNFSWDKKKIKMWNEFFEVDQEIYESTGRRL
jgi:hypothetical protein